MESQTQSDALRWANEELVKLRRQVNALKSELEHIKSFLMLEFGPDGLTTPGVLDSNMRASQMILKALMAKDDTIQALDKYIQELEEKIC